MRKKIFTFLVAMLASNNFVHADFIQSVIGPTQTITYHFYTESRTAEVVGYVMITGSVVIPEQILWADIYYTVKGIGTGAFRNCTNLTSIIMPDLLERIGNYAFYDCSNLTNVTFPFNRLKSIGDYAFYGCSQLNMSVIPFSVTHIGECAFAYCDGISAITIGDNVVHIGEGAFGECCNLCSVKIGNGVTSIPTRTFIHCSNLTSVTIPNSVTSIGKDAFYRCRSLPSVAIPNSVTSIGEGAFMECFDLASVSIPNSVTIIGKEAFWGCISLPSVTIPNSVTRIGEAAFFSCISLPSVTIPNSVTSIGERAFLHCSSLDSIALESETPAILGAEAFYYTNNCPFFVPCSAIDVYKTVWSEYADRITCPGAPCITVRLNPESCEDWSVVRLWAWTANGNLFEEWPGIVVDQDADGWYSYTFNKSIVSVNIIWTDGTNQTIDIDGVTESTCYSLNSTIGKTITVSVQPCSTTTDINTPSAHESGQKLLYNNHIYIRYGDEMYSIFGQKVTL